MVPEWAYGTLLALALVHLFAVYFLHTRGGHPAFESGDGRAGATDGEEPVDGDVVTCPECGAENERDYRFCRGCVTELPGGVGVARSNATTRTRRLT